MKNTVDLYIPGGQDMLLVARLATVGYVARAGLTLDAADDIKLAVTEALGVVGGERLHLRLCVADDAVEIAIEGDGTAVAHEKAEIEVVRCVLESMTDEVVVEGEDCITAIRMKKRLPGGAR